MQLEELEALYADNQKCAELIGLTYTSDEAVGLSRKRRGKGFTFTDKDGKKLTDAKIRQQITELTIPPAWQKVWICPNDKGHILATGLDEKGRKQYIYHPKWRAMRDIVKFYRSIAFANCLPTIRRSIEKDLQRPALDGPKVMAVMLWLLDNTYIRIGNEQYYEQNESVGLTTLTHKNIVIAGSVITLAFRGKSGKDHHITFDDPRIARMMQQLIDQKGERLFRYTTEQGYHAIESAEINAHLHTITGQHISAKDFRTWGGTLMAFNHLVRTEQLPAEETPKKDKVLVEAVDAAAQVLGNTRTVARSSYVHPDLLQTYGSKDFTAYYREASKRRKRVGLDKLETQLIYFLEHLFEDEFELLKKA
ncbi:MAG: topoisomerase [Candidatus Saccharibacteria bacterium]|nr:topoisomerase [Candidatus Saccharibacteria bacterium]